VSIAFVPVPARDCCFRKIDAFLSVTRFSMTVTVCAEKKMTNPEMCRAQRYAWLLWGKDLSDPNNRKIGRAWHGKEEGRPGEPLGRRCSAPLFPARYVGSLGRERSPQRPKSSIVHSPWKSKSIKSVF